MRIPKLWFYEVITAIALMGIAQVCLVNQMLLPFGKAMLIGFYLLIAVTTEAMIASSLRPERGLLLALNVTVAAIVFLAGWSGGIATLKLSALVGIVTLAMRLAVAAASLRASKLGVRRGMATLVGSTFLLLSVVFIYNLGRTIYENYYLYPRLKGEYYIMPTRWQDFAWLVELVGEIILLLYLGYRLLKYAFRPRPALTSA